MNSPDPFNLNIPNLAVVSLAAAEVTGSHSTDRADTFSTPNPATAGVPFDDRMWIDALDDPNHVYMEYHDFGTTSQIFVQRSNDGGQTYTNALGTVVDAATEPSVGPPTGNIAGQIKVDRSSCTSHGNLYQIFVGPDNPIDNSNNSSSFLNAAYVGVASGVSLTNPTLSFTDYKVFSCGAGSTCPSGAGLGNLFPALAVDKFGYLYAAWSDNTTIYYSFSVSQGTSWSPAIKVWCRSSRQFEHSAIDHKLERLCCGDRQRPCDHAGVHAEPSHRPRQPHRADINRRPTWQLRPEPCRLFPDRN
ncbi:MAG: hypothetical protein DMG86_18540 [Acidobacteria bacterium]|nr:MAG: hypothetical protein DMG86_18540 [Acidobacteriota bacterium]